MRRHRPRIKIDPAFRRAVYNDVRGLVRLANLIGCPSYPNVARLLKGPAPDTLLNRERLKQLAGVIGYTGDVIVTTEASRA